MSHGGGTLRPFHATPIDSAVGSWAGAWAPTCAKWLVIDALTMALRARKPDRRTIIHHSRHGGQFIGCSGRRATTLGSPIDGRRRFLFRHRGCVDVLCDLTKDRLLHDSPRSAHRTGGAHDRRRADEGDPCRLRRRRLQRAEQRSNVREFGAQASPGAFSPGVSPTTRSSST